MEGGTDLISKHRYANMPFIVNPGMVNLGRECYLVRIDISYLVSGGDKRDVNGIPLAL